MKNASVDFFYYLCIINDLKYNPKTIFMANDIESQNSINSLKASFCRQHFQDLLQFLRDFDISSKLDEEGNDMDYEDDFNMHFLLQAYNEEKIPAIKYKESEEDYNKRKEKAHASFLNNQREQKENCKWYLNDVKEADVLHAVEEYFSIISKQEYTKELGSILVSSLITEEEAKTIFSGDSSGKLYKFEDDSTLNILQHLNIKISGEEKTLGAQRKAFAQFILGSLETKENPQNKSFSDELYNQRPEARFIQAFELLASIRNWTNHEYVSFLNDKFNSYCLYRYIIFTHIGIIYISRRIWNNSDALTNLSKNNYSKPLDYNLEPTILKVNIRANKSTHTISDCEYLYEGDNAWHPVTGTSQHELSFMIKVKKYQLFNIKFECNNKSYDYVGKLNYYAWEPTLDIFVRPPKNVSYSFKGIASEDKKTEQYLSKIFIKCIETYLDENISNKDNEKCNQALKMLGELEPNLVELKELVGKVDRESAERKRIVKEKLLPQLKTIDKDISHIKTAMDWIKEYLLNKERNKKRLWLAIIIIIAGYCLYRSCVNDIFTNVLWLRYWLYYIFAAIILTYFSFRLLTNNWNPCKAIKEEGKLKYWIPGILAIVFGVSPFLLSYQSGKALAENYDFAGNKEKDNQEVVSFLEESMEKSEDVSVISKLFSYYQLYGNNAEKANNLWTRIGENATKHPEEVIKAAEIFLATGDNVKLKNAIDICPKNYKDTSVVVMRLNGIMMAGGYGVDKKLEKGLELLDKASSKGDLEATYWLGHIASSIEFQEWNETESSSKIFMRYDILLAINQLRKASVLPKAAIELGNIYADLNMNDSAEYYYLKALSIDENSLDAKYQIGRLYDKMGKDDNQYMSEAISRSYAPAMLYKAERDSDHTSAIELYKLFDDSVKARRYDKKYREDYRYIRPIVFEYVAAHNSRGFNGIDSAYNYLQKSRPNGHFNIEFVKGIRAMTSVDSATKQNSWKFFRESADKGCLYAKMMCIYKDVMKILRCVKKGDKLPQKYVDDITNKYDSLYEIGEEIPFSRVLLSCILGKTDKNLDRSEHYAHEALIRGHLAGIVALNENAFYYNNLINEIIPTWDDDHPKQFSESIQFNQITEKDLHAVKGFWISTQLGLRYSPISANKMGFISLGAYLTRIKHYAYEPEKEYPIEYFHFWCDVAIANHDYLNECNRLRDIIKIFLQKGGQMNVDACRYLIEEPYTKKLIRAASLDMSKYPKPTYREFLTSSIKIYERLTGLYDHPNDSIPIFIKPAVRFASIPVLYGQYEDHDILYECSDCFSPYSSKVFDSRLKDLPKEQIIDFFGYDIYQ